MAGPLESTSFRLLIALTRVLSSPSVGTGNLFYN
jgi:hypothetical protein